MKQLSITVLANGPHFEKIGSSDVSLFVCLSVVVFFAVGQDTWRGGPGWPAC